jgi:hypothetical protein
MLSEVPLAEPRLEMLELAGAGVGRISLTRCGSGLTCAAGSQIERVGNELPTLLATRWMLNLGYQVSDTCGAEKEGGSLSAPTLKTYAPVVF